MDVIDEIKRLKQLLDDEVITLEDFEEQKKKILEISSKENNIEIYNQKINEKSRPKSLDEYEMELIEESKEVGENKKLEIIDDLSNEELYVREKLKEKAKLDAKEENRKEKNKQIKQEINKGFNGGKRIFKWVLTIFCWLMSFGSILTLLDNVIVYLVSAIIFFILGLIVCPKITDYIQNEKYMKYKKWIMFVLIVIFIIISSLYV